MAEKLVCLCSMVAEEEIMAALKKGALSVSDIQKTTSAGTTCGRCLPQISRMVNDFIFDLPADSQLEIIFE